MKCFGVLTSTCDEFYLQCPFELSQVDKQVQNILKLIIIFKIQNFTWDGLYLKSQINTNTKCTLNVAKKMCYFDTKIK